MDNRKKNKNEAVIYLSLADGPIAVKQIPYREIARAMDILYKENPKEFKFYKICSCSIKLYPGDRIKAGDMFPLPPREKRKLIICK